MSWSYFTLWGVLGAMGPWSQAPLTLPRDARPQPVVHRPDGPETASSRRPRDAVHRVGTASVHTLCGPVEAASTVRRHLPAPSWRPPRTIPIRARGPSNSSACRVRSACRATNRARATNVTSVSGGLEGPLADRPRTTRTGARTTTPARNDLRTGVGAERLRRSRRPRAARSTSRAGGTSARSPSTVSYTHLTLPTICSV